MRLSTDPDRDEERAYATIATAVQAGITMFDTAHAYARDETELGHNERLLAATLRACGADAGAHVITKGGMGRAGAAWVPDGRARAIRAGCEASLAALGGIPIDTYLLHAPDPRTPWATSVRALARLRDDGLVKRVGLSNVNRHQLDEALGLAPVAVVQVALSLVDDAALRGGLMERCAEQGITLIAHSPLGGPRRAGSVVRRPALMAVSARHAATPAEVALAWLLGLSPLVIAIPGARRPESAASAARAAMLELTEPDRAEIAAAFQIGRPVSVRRSFPPVGGAEVVMVMGIPGAGKTRLAQEILARGYERLNRDERGGSLRAIAQALDERLAGGARRLLLDNTYLTRAARSHVIEAAARHGAEVRCLWLNTPLAQAQVNLVTRLIELAGRLPSPEELRTLARMHEGVMAPTSQMRTLRELEPPATDEGFAAVEEVPFRRAPTQSGEDGAAGVLVAAPALERRGWREALAAADPSAPHLVFDWRPDAAADALDEAAAQVRRVIAATVKVAVCPHGAGPPRCWCRPPLPGLALAFAAAHRLEPAACAVVGSGPAHRTLANALGARHILVVA